MTENNLFDNPMVNAARRSMTPEQLAQYAREGEYLFNMIDSIERDPVQESVLYIVEYLKSGLRPDDLTEDEQHLMDTECGSGWRTRYS
jgi:hypothetical protein